MITVLAGSAVIEGLVVVLGVTGTAVVLLSSGASVGAGVGCIDWMDVSSANSFNFVSSFASLRAIFSDRISLTSLKSCLSMLADWLVVSP